MIEWLDRVQRSNRVVGFVVAVIYKYVDDQGGYLAALITYYAFVSLFPALLLLTTVLGIVLVGRPDLQEQILDTAATQFPVIGEQLTQPEGLSGGVLGVVVGVAGALYGGLGVGQAVQNAMDTVWAVPRNSRLDPLRSRLRSLLLLIIVGTALVGATLLSALGRASEVIGPFGRLVAVVLALLVNTAVCVAVFRVATARHLTYRQVMPGAAAAAIVWQLLQSFGAVYVGNVMRTASSVNGLFALVLGLLAFLYLIATTLILCAEANAVAVDRLYPRALLSPFTDEADLTAGDRKAYRQQVKAQRAKGFQRIDVTFEQDGPDRR